MNGFWLFFVGGGGGGRVERDPRNNRLDFGGDSGHGSWIQITIRIQDFLKDSYLRFL